MNNGFNLNLSGKSCVVAGGDGAIGLSIAQALLRQGAAVSILDRNNANKKVYPDIFWYTANLRNVAEINEIIGDIGEKRGVDILVHTAGINPAKLLPDITEADWESVIETNLKSCLFLAKAAHPYLKKKGGCVILISSITATIGFAGLSVYGTSKGGIDSMVRNLACELAGDNIRVNAVAPGTVKTPMTKAFCWGNETKLKAHAATIPMDRIAEPEDIANAVLFFASDLSRYVTGQTLYVDGGMTAMQADFIDLRLRSGA